MASITRNPAAGSPPAPLSPPPGPAEPPAVEGVAVDWSFISDREGGLATRGYVPRQADGTVIGQSGVTIGCGVDLGQHGAPTLAAWDLPDGVIEKVRPYLGLRREAAVKVLADAPLELSEDEAAALTAGARQMILLDVASRYDRAAAGRRRFVDLSPGAQTALVSVAYQYGARLDLRTPRFWSRAVGGDEAAMRAELESFGDAYRTRRRAEAALITTRRPQEDRGMRKPATIAAVLAAIAVSGCLNPALIPPLQAGLALAVDAYCSEAAEPVRQGVREKVYDDPDVTIIRRPECR